MPIAFEVVGEFLADFGGLHARKYTRCRCRAAVVALPLSRCRCRAALVARRLASLHMVGVGVLCGSSRLERRLAARSTAPPGGGAGCGRSLRGHPHLPVQDRNSTRYRLATTRAFQAISARRLSHGHAELRSARSRASISE